jgi:glycosyltransferase involved in cell wall biosynthesis
MSHPALTVVSLYNRYLNRGGEDQVFEAEAELLAAHGYRVIRMEDHLREPAGWRERWELARNTVWSNDWHIKMWQLLEQHRPDIVHIHNWWPQMSPAVCYVAHSARVPVIHTLHNYRLLCPNAIFFRDGHTCEDCLGKTVPWPGVLHACYQRSRVRTAVIANVLARHRKRKTWSEQVDVYIALSEFARCKFIEGGLPAERIVVKPNFVYPTPAMGEGDGGYALYVGRLAEPKGIATLLAGWERMHGKLPLKIVGDGPMSTEVQAATRGRLGIEWLGRVSHDRVVELMQAATALVFPSICYEGFPMAIVEAFATGLPVVASDLGTMSSLVQHGRTGLHFRPGDAASLAHRVEWISTHSVERRQMRQNARAEFDAKYTAEKNYDTLIHIYETAIERLKSVRMTQ